MPKVRSDCRLFRSVHTGGVVHWYGEVSVLSASCVSVRSEVKVHHAGGVASGVSDGRSGTSASCALSFIRDNFDVSNSDVVTFVKLSGIPSKLKAACIHSNMSQKQRETAIEKVSRCQIYEHKKYVL